MTIADWASDFFAMAGADKASRSLDDAETSVSSASWRVHGFGLTLATMFVLTMSLASGPLAYRGIQGPPVDLVYAPAAVAPAYDALVEELLNSPSEAVIASLDWLA